MATINAISVALFNAAAGGYSAEMEKNGAAFANAVGPVLEKDISTDALFVEHLLGNLGVLSNSAVYAQAKAAVAGLVTTKGRLGATVDAIDFLKAQEGSSSAYATIAATFAAKVNAAAVFSAANATERDITKLISGVTGVDTDVAAIASAVAAQKAADDAAAAAAVAKAAADAKAAAEATAAAALKAANDKAAADAATAKAAADKAAADAAAALKAANDKATADATAAKTAADAAAADAAAALKAANDKAAADLTAANTAAAAAAKAASDAAAAAATKAAADLKAATDKAAADQAAAVAAQKATDDAAAATAAAKAAADLKAANDQITALKNPVGQATTLSVNADTVLGVTGGNDTITSTDTTYTSNDLVVDASTTDSDVLNFTAAAGVTSTNSATVIGIEALNFNFNSFGTPTVTATNVRTGTLTVNQSQAGASGDATVSGVNNVTVKAGAGITGTLALNTVTADSAVVVNAGDAATVTVTSVAAGSATVSGSSKLNSVSLEGKTLNATTSKSSSTVTLLGTTATTDAATVSAGAATSIVIGGTSKDIEALTVSGNGAASTATITLGTGGSTPTTFVVSGSQNVTLKGADGIFSGKTVTDSSTATSTITIDATSTTTLGTAVDLSKAAVDVVKIADAVNTSNTTVTLANNANVTFTEDLATATKTLTLDINDQTTANVTTGVVALTLSKAQSGGAIAVDATASSDNISTLNLTIDSEAQTGLNLTAGTPVTVNVFGSRDVVFAATSTAKAIDASAATGAITVNYDNTSDIATVTGGSGADTFTNATTAIGTKVTINGNGGNDSFTMLSTAKAAINGGDGYDKVTLVGDVTSLEMTSVEELALSNAVTSAKATQLSGKSFIMSGAYGWTFGTAASNFDTSNIDLSGLTINNTTGFTVDASNGLSTTLYTTATGVSITGSSVADVIKGTANADTIIGGAGNDVLTGNSGADTINGGAGGDTIYGDNAGTKAVAIFTISTAATATNTVTVNIHGVDVAVIIPATTSSALQATQIAEAISGNAALANLVTATASTATVTITSLVDGNTFGVDLSAGTASAITIKESGTASLVIADGLDSGTTVQTVSGTAAAIEIVTNSVVGTLGSSATDTLTGGADTDVFVFNNGNGGAAPSATVFDTITDFATASDVIDYAPGAITIVSYTTTASSGVAKITSAGVATFHADDSTLALKIIATEAAINAGGTATAGQTAIFQDGSDAYVLISDGTDSVGSGDILIKLVGVSTTATAFDTITLSNGNMTLA